MILRQPPGDTSNLELAAYIANEIEESGPMTFARFMEVVVGHPKHGYYASSPDRVGETGDFLTAPETHPLFGWLVARQLADCWEHIGGIGLEIREHGAGRGTLANQVLDWFVQDGPAELQSISYQVNDINPEHLETPLRQFDDGCRMLEITSGSFDGSRFTGVTIANELLDALPFHRLIVVNGELRELLVGVKDGWFVEVVSEVTQSARVAIPMSDDLAEGQHIEVSPATWQWIGDVSSQIDRGYLIIIDYGYERQDLLNATRFPSGTMKTYRQHIVTESPFEHIGNQDITAHVDFSLVMEAARISGLRLEGLTTLAEFVAGLGLDDLLLRLQEPPHTGDEYISARSAAMEFLNPSGLGRFRVGIFSRGVSDGKSLRGLRFSLGSR